MCAMQKVIMLAALLLFSAGLLLRLKTKQEPLTGNNFKSVFRKCKCTMILTATFLVSFFSGCAASYTSGKIMNPAFSIKFNFEEASRGLNPDGTRFNANDLLNEDVLQEIIQKKHYDLTTEELRDCFTVRSSYDDSTIDSRHPKIATEYQIALTEKVKTTGIDTEQLIDTAADAVKDDYLSRHIDHAQILDMDLSDISDLDYMDVDDYLKMKADLVKNYLAAFQVKAQTYKTVSGQTFSSLSQKVSDYINTPLAEYTAYITQNGLSKNKADFLSVYRYTNRMLKINYDKKMAAYNARIDAINLYDPSMANVVLVPTDDKSGEFYMSRTKIGVDYFASDANSVLNEASTLQQQMEENKVLATHVKNGAKAAQYEKADTMIQELQSELIKLSREAKTLHTQYLADKTGDGVTENIYHPGTAALCSVKKNGMLSCILVFSMAFFFAEVLRFGHQ